MGGPWRIKEFAARIGVSEATLRAWERRYGLLDPARSEGGYRLYAASDERRVVAMQAHMSRGVAAAEAAALALSETLPSGDLPREPAAIAGQFVAAVDAYDATAADQLLEVAFGLGHASAIQDVLMPALREIGERWAGGEMTVAHEHFASHLVERRLMGRAADWETGSGPLALLACPSGERHSIGLLSFGVALAGHGWRITYLGADMPVGQVADAAARMHPDVIVLSATTAERLTDHTAEISALGAVHRTLVAGPGATAAVAGALGVERLAPDPVAAAAEL